MNKTVNIEGIDKDIKAILMPYLAVNSETATRGERNGEAFLLDYFNGIPYFQENKEYFGRHAIPDDALGRAVCWAVVKGRGDDTVILLHHYDVVGVEDFKTMHDLAFQPDLLKQELVQIAGELQPEAREDLLSGEYLFGRGTADMKGGGAIQLALLKRYSEEADFKGNVILISLPDEENLSAGMRAAVDLLIELKNRFGLKYVYAFNSEPHQRKEKRKGLLSEGSVGKMLAFVYARGFLSHVGKVFEGFNPLSVLSEIVTRTEISPSFLDIVGGEAAPPPTWLYLRDNKENYDVSMPLSAGGCISILTLDSNPTEILNVLKQISLDSFESVIRRIKESYSIFCNSSGRKLEPLPWNPSVITFDELLKEAYQSHGEIFTAAYQSKMHETGQKVKAGEINLMESSFLLVDFVYNYISDLSPRVVLGFVPPYYPNVSNLLLKDRSEREKNLSTELSDYCNQKYGQEYEREYYYTGISDMSYFALKDSGKIKEELSHNMPLYGEIYSIPLEGIEELSMPCMNIGPWGKDFHKLTERVCKLDLYERTPDLLNRAVLIMLDQK